MDVLGDTSGLNGPHGSYNSSKHELVFSIQDVDLNIKHRAALVPGQTLYKVVQKRRTL